MIYYLLLIAANQLLTIIFYMLEKGKTFSSWNFLLKQLIIGVIFGIFGCIATEYGALVQVPLSNVRDSFPLTAGLLFGGPSGIISGIICGFYRFFSPTLVAGSYTRISCTITSILAGIAAALMRKYFFKKKIPTVFLAFLFVISIEAFHMAMIFLTHSSDLSGAYYLVKSAFVKIAVANSFSVSLAVIIFRLFKSKFIEKHFPRKPLLCENKISEEKINKEKECCCKKKERKPVSGPLTFFLMACIIGAFVLVGYFLFAIHTRFTKNNMAEILREILSDVEYHIKDNDEVTDEIIFNEIYFYEDQMIDALLLVDKNNFQILTASLYTHSEENTPEETSFTALDNNSSEIFQIDSSCQAETLYETFYYGTDIYYMYIPFGEYYIFSIVEKDSVMFFRDSTVYMVALLNIIVFSILFFCSYVLLKTNIISNMRRLIEATVDANCTDSKCCQNLDVKSDFFMPITKELNYTFKLLYKNYDDLNGQMKKEHEKKEEFEYMAEHDKLTGLLNREGLKKVICPLVRKKSDVAFLFIDVDKFKEINDSFGHVAGDKILKKISWALKEEFRAGDIAVRYGGDEFILIMPGCNIKDKKRIIYKIKELNNKFANPEDNLPSVTISVGAAFSERGYTKELLIEADRALYITKENGRAHCTCSDNVIR